MRAMRMSNDSARFWMGDFMVGTQCSEDVLWLRITHVPVWRILLTTGSNVQRTSSPQVELGFSKY